MIEEQFTDEERQAVCSALAAAMVKVTEGGRFWDVLLAAFCRAIGTDTVLIARRAYPSKAEEPPARNQP